MEKIEWRDAFDVVYEDGNAIMLQSKKVYTYDANGLKFDYNYAIRTLGEINEGIIYMLSICPTYASLNENSKQSLLSCCGIAEDEVNVLDIETMGYQQIVFNKIVNGTFELSENMLNDIANAVPTIDVKVGTIVNKKLGNTTYLELFKTIINH